MDTKRHTSKQYETELQEVKESLLYLGALTQQAIEDSIRALLDRDTGLARKVIANDAFIDKLDGEVEEKCICLLALRQPAARDLRFITTAIKINGHLERIGDMAVKICEKVALLNEEAQLKPYIDLPRMAEIARGMIRKSLDALVKEDVALANEVRREDEAVDSLNEQIFRELLTYMVQDGTTITRAVGLMLVGRHLERIADHATNIGEDVIYMVKGQSIKHHCDDRPPKI